MKRSRVVDAFVVVSLAATLEACGSQPRRCLDQLGNPADERNCTSGGGKTGGYYYHWGGGASSHSSTESGTTRGVIGSEGAAHGAGEAGGAHGGGAGE